MLLTHSVCGIFPAAWGREALAGRVGDQLKTCLFWGGAVRLGCTAPIQLPAQRTLVALGKQDAVTTLPARGQCRSARWAGELHAGPRPDAVPRRQVLGSLADLPSGNTSRARDRAPGYGLARPDAVASRRANVNVAEAASGARRHGAAIAAHGRTDEPGAGEGPAAQALIVQVDRSSFPVAARAVHRDL
jgi:hypothetical protein